MAHTTPRLVADLRQVVAGGGAQLQRQKRADAACEADQWAHGQAHVKGQQLQRQKGAGAACEAECSGTVGTADARLWICTTHLQLQTCKHTFSRQTAYLPLLQ